MVNIIKEDGKKIREPVEQYVIELIDGCMFEVSNFKEATAVMVGSEYIDCESSETEWHMRLDKAKMIGLFILSNETNAKTVIYDERIGKIPFSYTDPNPDYSIPQNAELIRVECDESFMLSLAKMKYIRIWEKVSDEYLNYLVNRNIDEEISSYISQFKQKMQSIPLHERL